MMEGLVEELARNVARKYGEMLLHFRPCRPGSEFLEQNLVNLLSNAFLEKFDCGLAYAEIPFQSAKGKWDCRLDAFLANEESAYLVEAKGLGENPNRLGLVEQDLERAHSQLLRESFGEMAGGNGRNYTMPPNVSGIVIADCWCAAIADQWRNNRDLRGTYPRIAALSTLALKAGAFGSFDYFILVGQTAPLDWPGNHQENR